MTNSQYKNITKPNDAFEYMGTVVAFQTNIPYFAKPEMAWHRDEAPKLFYGFVKNELCVWGNEKGPQLQTVLYPQGRENIRAIVQITLSGKNFVNLDAPKANGTPAPFLKMRPASELEIASIHNALQKDAKLELDNDGDFCFAVRPHDGANGMWAMMRHMQR